VIEDCPAFTLLSDPELNACRVFSHIDEPISGTLDKLPGCNEIQWGPERAVSQECDDTVTIGNVILPFTDRTSEGWKYVACAKDIAGSARTLEGPSDNGDHTTVDTCLAFCETKGYSYAGVEWNRECYCGNNGIPEDRLFKEGLFGNCEDPCVGDPTQKCGSAQQIGVYQKCGDGEACANAPLPGW
jgi:hypothetical protein